MRGAKFQHRQRLVARPGLADTQTGRRILLEVVIGLAVYRIFHKILFADVDLRDVWNETVVHLHNAFRRGSGWGFSRLHRFGGGGRGDRRGVPDVHLRQHLFYDRFKRVLIYHFLSLLSAREDRGVPSQRRKTAVFEEAHLLQPLF